MPSIYQTIVNLQLFFSMSHELSQELQRQGRNKDVLWWHTILSTSCRAPIHSARAQLRNFRLRISAYPLLLTYQDIRFLSEVENGVYITDPLRDVHPDDTMVLAAHHFLILMQKTLTYRLEPCYMKRSLLTCNRTFMISLCLSPTTQIRLLLPKQRLFFVELSPMCNLQV